MQHRRNQFLRAIIRQFLRHRASERIGVFGRRLSVGSQNNRAIGMPHQAVKREQAVFIGGAIRRQRHLATAAQRTRQRTFRGYASSGFRMIERQQHFY